MKKKAPSKKLFVAPPAGRAVAKRLPKACRRWLDEPDSLASAGCRAVHLQPVARS